MTQGDLTDLNGLNTDRYGQFFWNPYPLSSVSVRLCPFCEINCGICFANVTSKNRYSCRKFQAQKRYEFLSQTVEEAKYRCKTLSVASVERLSQFAAAQPSAAKAMEGILRTLRCTPLYFCRQKKSTHGNPCGLPSVALAKDGGRNRTRIYDLHDVNVAL